VDWPAVRCTASRDGRLPDGRGISAASANRRHRRPGGRHGDDPAGRTQPVGGTDLPQVSRLPQESDGGWGDPILTALCLRALLGGRGGGEAIEQGLSYLAGLQKDEGIWPRIPFRRMPADALASAMVLYHLSHEQRFRDAVLFENAVRWFEDHSTQLDAPTRKLWFSVCLRCGINRARSMTLWTSAS
jgi:hypothetical protein